SMGNNTTKNIIIILIGVVVALAVIFGAVAYTKLEKNEPVSTELEQTDDTEQAGEEAEETEESEEDSEEEEPEEAVQAEPEKEVTKFYGGTYFIGEEMTAGEYVIEPNYPEGYFEITSDLSAAPSSLVASGTYNVRTYVSVTTGQYLKFDGVAIPVEEADPHIPKDGIYQHEAMYLVGFDIQPGDYRAKLDTGDGSEGYVEIRRNSSWAEGSVIKTIPVEDEVEISLDEDTYVNLVGVKLTDPIL
ncbi:MAG: hypothetical protein LUD81_08010, partial [Clostridiales bacterium]|nr:hypothetical protein [Clostridiales bacterium]